TARHAAAESWLLGPTTKRSNVYRSLSGAPIVVVRAWDAAGSVALTGAPGVGERGAVPSARASNGLGIPGADSMGRITTERGRPNTRSASWDSRSPYLSAIHSAWNSLPAAISSSSWGSELHAERKIGRAHV